MAPRLLYVLTGIAVEEKDWPTALSTAKRLVDEFPSDDAADDALERVGSGAAAGGAWPVVAEAYTLLEKRYPRSPFVESARVTLAEAQVESGRPETARATLEQAVQTSPNDSRAWVALARAREASGDRAGALDAYARGVKDGSAGALRPEAALGTSVSRRARRAWRRSTRSRPGGSWAATASRRACSTTGFPPAPIRSRRATRSSSAWGRSRTRPCRATAAPASPANRR